MYNFLASCGLCSLQPSPGDEAYEAFPKLRTDSPLNPTRTASERRLQPQIDENINTFPKSSVVAGDYTFKDLVNDNPR